MVAPLWLQHASKIQGKSERKLCAVAMTKLLCETPLFLERFSALWPKFLFELVKFLEIPEQVTTTVPEFDAPDDADEVAAQSNYKVEFTKLSFASKSEEDKTQGIPDAKIYLANMLNQLLKRVPQVGGAIRSLDPQVMAALVRYFQMSNLNPVILQQ